MKGIWLLSYAVDGHMEPLSCHYHYMCWLLTQMWEVEWNHASLLGHKGYHHTLVEALTQPNMEEFQNPLPTYERCWSIYMLWMGTWIHYHEITTTYINPDFVWHRSLQSYLLHNQQCFKESELLLLVLQYLKYGNPFWKTLIANWLPMAVLNCTQNNMVHAWVGHFVTPLKRRYNESDWWVTSQKPH